MNYKLQVYYIVRRIDGKFLYINASSGSPEWVDDELNAQVYRYGKVAEVDILHATEDEGRYEICKRYARMEEVHNIFGVIGAIEDGGGYDGPDIGSPLMDDIADSL